jgi:uncharacterized protein (TIRG00374 family)
MPILTLTLLPKEGEGIREAIVRLQTNSFSCNEKDSRKNGITPEDNMKKKWLVLAAKIAFALGIIVFLFYKKIDIRDLTGRIEIIGPAVILACWVIYASVWLLSTTRWHTIIGGQVKGAGYRKTLEYYLIGLFFNNIMLGSMGGDVVKAYYLSRDMPGRREAGVMTVVIDRLVGFLTIFAIGFVGLVLNFSTPEIRPVSIAFILFFAVILGGLVFAYNFQRWVAVRPFIWIWRYVPLKRNIQKLHEAFYSYRNCKLLLVKAVGLSVSMQLIHITIIYYLAVSMGLEQVHYRHLLLIMPVIATVFSIPLTPAGWGTGEVAFYKLFGLIGVAPDSALALDFIMRAIIISWSLLGGILYVSTGLRIDRTKEKTSTYADL